MHMICTDDDDIMIALVVLSHLDCLYGGEPWQFSSMHFNPTLPLLCRFFFFFETVDRQFGSWDMLSWTGLLLWALLALNMDMPYTCVFSSFTRFFGSGLVDIPGLTLPGQAG